MKFQMNVIARNAKIEAEDVSNPVEEPVKELVKNDSSVVREPDSKQDAFTSNTEKEALENPETSEIEPTEERSIEEKSTLLECKNEEPVVKDVVLSEADLAVASIIEDEVICKEPERCDSPQLDKKTDIINNECEASFIEEKETLRECVNEKEYQEEVDKAVMSIKK